MPNIASFSKTLALVICSQWGAFCSSRDGGVIVPMAPTDELSRGTCSSYVDGVAYRSTSTSTSLSRIASSPLLSCSGEFNAGLGNQRHLSLGKASEFAPPPLLPTSLTRASSLPVDPKDHRPMLKSRSLQAEMSGLENQPQRTVVAISVFSGSVVPVVEEERVAQAPLALALPNGVVAEDELPADSPITLAARQFSSVATKILTTFPYKFDSPESFVHFQDAAGPVVVALLRVIITGAHDSVDEVEERIRRLEAQICDTCHNALNEDTAFIWSSIPTYEARDDVARPYLTRGVLEKLYLVRSVLGKLNHSEENLSLYVRNTISRETLKGRLERAMVDSEGLLRQLAEEQELLSKVKIVNEPKKPTNAYYGGGECF